MRLLAALGLIAALAGCGQTGPLYLPGEAPPRASQPAPEAPPAEPADATPTEPTE
ncbi:LPS translocon maturation chaperone LptM [Halioglobus japonicus]|uniref:Sugar transporter n=1 Tax=Halioglobus japonicus TaxID=930805 RepID=A0AAP8MDG0_9GAMM|nr:hypothetical protein C0029_14260 [Halioglobus japonicus]